MTSCKFVFFEAWRVVTEVDYRFSSKRLQRRHYNDAVKNVKKNDIDATTTTPFKYQEKRRQPLFQTFRSPREPHQLRHRWSFLKSSGCSAEFNGQDFIH